HQGWIRDTRAHASGSARKSRAEPGGGDGAAGDAHRAAPAWCDGGDLLHHPGTRKNDAGRDHVRCEIRRYRLYTAWHAALHREHRARSPADSLRVFAGLRARRYRIAVGPENAGRQRKPRDSFGQALDRRDAHNGSAISTRGAEMANQTQQAKAGPAKPAKPKFSE